jgi:hypothetical protein
LPAISGALAALADTLYPVHSLAAGFVQDLTPGANFTVKLRAAHPIIAAAVSLWLISYAISRASAAQRLARFVVATPCAASGRRRKPVTAGADWDAAGSSAAGGLAPDRVGRVVPERGGPAGNSC